MPVYKQQQQKVVRAQDQQECVQICIHHSASDCGDSSLLLHIRIWYRGLYDQHATYAACLSCREWWMRISRGRTWIDGGTQFSSALFRCPVRHLFLHGKGEGGRFLLSGLFGLFPVARSMANITCPLFSSTLFCLIVL
jgi:hypothetical protein